MARQTITERVEVAGTRPATFKLVEKAQDSFDLFRSTRRIGDARAEERGRISARFDGAGGSWKATADSPSDLLRLVGTFLLAHDAAAAKPAFLADRRPAEIPAAERRLGQKWARMLEDRRRADLATLIADARKRITPRRPGRS